MEFIMPRIPAKSLFLLMAILAISIGLYPAIYFLIERTFGLLGTKSANLLADPIWNLAFNLHIIFGGLSLLSGWSQFSSRLRKRAMQWHRWLGRIYVSAVLVSGLSGLYVAFFATGGLASVLGFALLAVFWLGSTGIAFVAISRGQIRLHQRWMLYSYAASFAAVTLRLWLPALVVLLGDFMIAYPLSAWLCWVPNLLFVYFYLDKGNRRKHSGGQKSAA
jgi:uncharacterized membrane protein